METNDQRAYLAELRATLTEDKLSLIDFDRLRSWLEELAPALERVNTDAEELRLLRQDFQARIAGMLKAIAATDRKRTGLQSALSVIEALPDMTSTQLIECYRQTAARFRDSFPASFGLLSSAPSAPGRSNQYGEYK